MELIGKKKYGIDLTCLLFLTVYQNRQKRISKIRKLIIHMKIDSLPQKKKV